MYNKLIEVYRGKKIFLTGHTGFKGAWMLKILSMLGAEVMGYSLKPRKNIDLFNLISGEKLCNSIISDIRNESALKNSILKFQPDFIFHLAAQPLVRYSYENPLETFEVNSIGTANILNASRFLNKKTQILIITTDKVYHNNEWQYPYRENDLLGGYDPYSSSKACAELIINSYRNSFFNLNNYQQHQKSLAVARAGNVIGGGDWSSDRIIPDIINSLKEGKDINIRNPNSVRPWQHVIEPIVGYLILASKIEVEPIKYSTAYNFGPNSNDTLSVLELVELSIKQWGSGNYNICKNQNQFHEAGLLKLDINKVIDEIGWYPKMNSSEAIADTISWYKEYLNSSSTITSYTETQILNYFNK